MQTVSLICSIVKYSSQLQVRRMGWAAVCQMTTTHDVKENINQADSLIKGAAKMGADMVFLPEAFDFIGRNSRETLELAQTIEGNTIRTFQDLAVENKVWLSLGGFHQKICEEDTKLCNSHVIISNCGHLVQTYHKTHLFDVEIPGKFRLKESDYVSAGMKISPPVDTPLGKLGLSICYDLRFPELNISLRKQGAQILTYPSAFTIPTGMAHWKPLLQARAIESQCYVVAAAQTGRHNDKRSSYGHAMIVDPWGTVVAECREGINFALAEIDLQYLNKIRRDMPVMEQRRPDLYGSVISQPSISQDGVPADDWIFQFGHASVRGSSVVHKTGLSLLFVNKKPVVPGHVLVSPLRNVKRLNDLSTEETTDLFSLVKQTETLLMRIYDTDSCTISIQDGPLAGQTISHLHVHLIPRKENDFKENDDVYRELEKHDKEDSGWRNEETMTAEANKFRQYWKDFF